MRFKISSFFLWIIVNYYHSEGKLAETNIKCEYSYGGRHLNIKELCRVMWEDTCASEYTRVTHACKTAGCSEGHVTVDGNKYFKRSKCALPMEKVKIRKDFATSQWKEPKAIKIHQSHTAETSAEEVSVLPEFNSARAEAGLLPEHECEAQQNEKGCKKKENISLFFQTTAGMLALIRPYGIALSMTEMFTSESYSQVFLFILRTFCGNLEHFNSLRYLGYDRACGLVPFLKDQAQNGSAGAKVLLDNVQYLVDIFHVSKHTEEVCMPPENELSSSPASAKV